ncbi:hypothetical protein SLEP1_g26425 [Rubroshorea leprosula]|uniref:Aminotransferase-like plant mobile domain-containing protein n=1 Tax=Rubroshorea leprosula TaxID=152421 RepID=A0AAV5JZF0_9ROSI|nr:hypothetical protein SLEP1_g26425 [Rubroshorea leprosula]
MEGGSESIVEVREEVMVSPTGGNPTVRKAHFIKPSTNSITGPFSKLHSLSLFSFPAVFDPKKCGLEVKFIGWRSRHNKWRTWVHKMASLHESTWKKAGVYGAIMNSTYGITKNDDLIFGVAERWFRETKSFIFPWGEATITLEDVMILGGFSVLGSPVFAALETEELKEIEKKLQRGRTELYHTPTRKAEQSLWMERFIGTDSEIEHQAFLVLWLSRFVFPSSSDLIVKSVFPIAIHLARGTRIALAPAVLANIYRDLSCLKEAIVATRELQIHEKSRDERLAIITLCSPFHLVLVWTWERFSELRPKPKSIRNGEPRLARWHGLRREVKNVRSVLDSAKASFDWRPYAKTITNWEFPKFYGEDEMWVSIDSCLDDELLAFARCLRVSALVGLTTVEQYLPHRVALQFGMDQDLPSCVTRSNWSPEIAWGDYSKPVGGGRLYVPPRFFEADVTTRYLEWWKESVLSFQEQRGYSSFLMIPKELTRSLNSTQPGSYSIKPSSARILTHNQKDISSSSGLSTGHKRTANHKEKNGALVLPESPPKSLLGLVGCSEAKSKTINAASPLDINSDSSDCSVIVLEVKSKEKGNSASSSPLSSTSKAVVDFRLQQELDTSPFPPGFPPKNKLVEAKSFVGEDREILQYSAQSPKRKGAMGALVPPALDSNISESSGCDLEIKEKQNTSSSPFTEELVDFGVQKELCNSLICPALPPKSKMVEAKCSPAEDKMTVEEHFRSFCKGDNAGNSSDGDYEDQLTLSQMLHMKRLHGVERKEVSNGGN